MSRWAKTDLGTCQPDVASLLFSRLQNWAGILFVRAAAVLFPPRLPRVLPAVGRVLPRNGVWQRVRGAGDRNNWRRLSNVRLRISLAADKLRRVPRVDDVQLWTRASRTTVAKLQEILPRVPKPPRLHHQVGLRDLARTAVGTSEEERNGQTEIEVRTAVAAVERNVQKVRRSPLSAAGFSREDNHICRVDRWHTQRVLTKNFVALARGQKTSETLATASKKVVEVFISWHLSHCQEEWETAACATDVDLVPRSDAASVPSFEYWELLTVSGRNAQWVLLNSAAVRAQNLKTLHQNNASHKWRQLLWIPLGRHTQSSDPALDLQRPRVLQINSAHLKRLPLEWSLTKEEAPQVLHRVRHVTVDYHWAK